METIVKHGLLSITALAVVIAFKAAWNNIYFPWMFEEPPCLVTIMCYSFLRLLHYVNWSPLWISWISWWRSIVTQLRMANRTMLFAAFLCDKIKVMEFVIGDLDSKIVWHDEIYYLNLSHRSVELFVHHYLISHLQQGSYSLTLSLCSSIAMTMFIVNELYKIYIFGNCFWWANLELLTGWTFMC